MLEGVLLEGRGAKRRNEKSAAVLTHGHSFCLVILMRAFGPLKYPTITTTTAVQTYSAGFVK
jgi:hypothetical protein